MNEEKTYEDADGNMVFTSAYLKARGSCCKTACLHCPYGFTLKKERLTFADWDPVREDEAREILQDSGKSDFDLTPFLPENVKFVMIKGRVCGLITKTRLQVKQLFLRRHFQNQGLDKDLVESYYFC